MKKFLNALKTLALALAGFVALPVSAQISQDPLVNLQNTGIGGNPQDAGTTLPQFIGNIIRVLLGLLGIIFVVLMVYAGFLWMTARGDSKSVDKAKDIIKQAIIGLIITMLAYAITGFVISAIVNATTGA